MSVQSEFATYLARMLGRSVADDQLLTLTSGQQARAAGWLAERGFAPAQLRKQLGAPFTPAGLLGDTGTSASRPEGAAPRRGSSRQAPPQTRAMQTVGIDIQCVAEVIPADALADPKSSPEMTAIFTLREISYAQSRPSLRETLCGLFCAKEALRKCDATLLAMPLQELEILPDEDGKPCFAGYSLSISHSGGFAIAVALSNAPSASAAPIPAAAPAAVVAQLSAHAQPSTAPRADTESSGDTPTGELINVRPEHGPRHRRPSGAGTFFENLLRRFVLHPARLWRWWNTH